MELMIFAAVVAAAVVAAVVAAVRGDKSEAARETEGHRRLSAERALRSAEQAAAAHAEAAKVAALRHDVRVMVKGYCDEAARAERAEDEVASLRTQMRGLTADAEGASKEASALSALVSLLIKERTQNLQRLNAANSRVKALEAFIERAYGPVDECEINTRVCTWCETADIAGGSACEVCDQPF